MRSFIAAAALAHSFANLVSAQTTISNETSSDCPQQGGVDLIVARASQEPVGYGIIGAVKDAVLSRIPGSNAEFVVYPATLANYTISESDGVVAARLAINTYIEKCPGQPLVVMGYSQGAQVTADSLVGQSVSNFPVNASIQEPLPESTLARTAAVIMMGDPTFVTEESFRVGNATRNSIFPRLNVDNFNVAGLASRTQSYCDEGDPYCAAGNQLIVHVRYVVEYGAVAADFVVKNVADWYVANGSGSTGTASASGSACSSPKTRSRAPTGTATRSIPSASASSSSTPVAPSATATGSDRPVSTGAASSLEIASAMGAVVAACFAFML